MTMGECARPPSPEWLAGLVASGWRGAEFPKGFTPGVKTVSCHRFTKALEGRGWQTIQAIVLSEVYEAEGCTVWHLSVSVSGGPPTETLGAAIAGTFGKLPSEVADAGLTATARHYIGRWPTPPGAQ